MGKYNPGHMRIRMKGWILAVFRYIEILNYRLGPRVGGTVAER